ncbi:patatin-like phospholipase family protein [Allostreptomyces psammosilenae]|uniref:NTE family protein n=1 Tax=Allostreptomyces psammosilenae TaxID=1892865 RepID=A0A853A6L4_9ACTN|nr:patatin-like phospholipase family protein [Allostreptomyces psammosilenae]NYI06188.1 NTE family protein [Allostreptomyces psammosilenae]
MDAVDAVEPVEAVEDAERGGAALPADGAGREEGAAESAGAVPDSVALTATATAEAAHERVPRRGAVRAVTPSGATATSRLLTPPPGGRVGGPASGPRRGLVLGGGGMLGAAWTIAALCALEEATGWNPGTAELIVGTSAGAVVGTLLATGASPAQLLDHQRGVPVSTGPLDGIRLDYDTVAGGALPPRPRPGIGSPAMLRETFRHPRTYPFPAVVSAFLPQGRGSIGPIGLLMETLLSGEYWPRHPGLRLVALDYETGLRVAFGDPQAPPASAAEAVMASCAIPGWFAPVEIGESRFMDGGSWSSTNADLLVGQGLDEVFVLAPGASKRMDRPRTVLGHLERRFRRTVTRQMLREAKVLRATGTRVRMLGPGPEDLEAMGGNMMDHTRRLTVLETALRTSREALAPLRLAPGPAGPAAADVSSAAGAR